MQLARRYGDQVDILGVSGRDDVSAMRDFVAKYDVPFPSVADTDLVIWRAAGVRGQPAWVFIDPDGSAELYYAPGEDQVRARLDALVRAS